MKNLILLISVMSTLMSCAQANNIENKDIRVQGYLFTITTLEKPININADTISIQIDRPKRHFFIPLSNMLPTFKETLRKMNDFKSNSLYLPLTLTDSKENIEFTNFSLKKFLKNNTINISQIDEYKSFQTDKETTIQIIENEATRWIYNVVYIDGIWEKIEVPFKWTEVIPIGNYRSNSLDKNHKDGYDYYFLKDINVISYKLDIKEKGITTLDKKEISLIHEAIYNKKN
jgi:hypothetical protein